MTNKIVLEIFLLQKEYNYIEEYWHSVKFLFIYHRRHESNNVHTRRHIENRVHVKAVLKFIIG